MKLIDFLPRVYIEWGWFGGWSPQASLQDLVLITAYYSILYGTLQQLFPSYSFIQTSEHGVGIYMLLDYPQSLLSLPTHIHATLVSPRSRANTILREMRPSRCELRSSTHLPRWMTITVT